MSADAPCGDMHPDCDADWTEEDWHRLLESLIQAGLLSWKEVTALTLGHLNPSQVGTSIASKRPFQRHFPKRKCWAAVRQWHFEQSGMCSDCGTRLELQADHIVPKEIVAAVGIAVGEEIGEVSGADLAAVEDRLLSALVESIGALDDGGGYPVDILEAIAGDLAIELINGVSDGAALAEVADRLENIVLRCRRCNVIRRPSHTKGGLTFLTAEAALMWLLLVKRPSTYEQFAGLCRAYGMTMASIRFEEAWAMARWLHSRALYEIAASSKYAP